jgi:signal transduction histidine kinase
MLHEFLTANRDELVARCRARVAQRPAPKPTATELEFGISLFLDQLIKTLRVEKDAPRDGASKLPTEIGSAAEKHGNELLRRGFTVDQVVHDYGDLCQSVTELAAEKNALVSVDEFRTFNRCLDNAIADAVTEFGRQRDQNASAAGTQAMNERLGHLAHDLRNLLSSAILAFQAIKSGSVAVTGATGAVLDRSLLGLRDAIDRTLLEVRLTAGLQPQRQRITIGDFVEEYQVAAELDARSRGIAFTVSPIDRALAVEADRPMLGSALSNLLQNAFKFTRRNGHVALTARAALDRVLIEVEDECGGLPRGRVEALFKPFEQAGNDRSGLGLGLTISRRAVEANGGRLSVRDVPGRGCIFTIDLPRPAAA